MNHKTDYTQSTEHTESSRMKLSMRRGIEAWFDVDDITIHLWASNWTGREKVTLIEGDQARVVSRQTSWRFKTPHAFTHNGHRYRLDLSIGMGKAMVELYRDGTLIDSDQINQSGLRTNPATGKLDWGHAMKYLLVPLLAGAAVGVSFGYLAGMVMQ